MANQQTPLSEVPAFGQPPYEDRDSITRTVIFQIPVLTRKKSGLLNRAMKDFWRARQIACDYFQNNNVFDVTYADQNQLNRHIRNKHGVNLGSQQVSYAISQVKGDYVAFKKSGEKGTPPKANRADTLKITRAGTYIFADDGRHYLNVRTGLDNVTLPLRVSKDPHHKNHLPFSESIPPKLPDKSRQRRPGQPIRHLEFEDYPGKTERIEVSTIQKRGNRRFTAHLLFSILKEQERDYDSDDARYVIGVDRGRNQLAYAALYDKHESTVIDWWNRGGDEVEHYMNEYSARIREFQSNHVWKQMEDARDRRFRYKKQIDYEVANGIVDLARSVDGSVIIVLEDLSGMSDLGSYSKESRRFNEWSFYRLRKFIQQKAEPYDIPIARIEPAGTSQKCSRCGTKDDIERQGVYFHCGNCEYEQHADANAAVNIAKRF